MRSFGRRVGGGPTRAPSSHVASRRRQLGMLLLLAVVVGVSGFGAVSVVKSRTRFDSTLPDAARVALEEARKSPTSRWAPELLAVAEDTYRRGMADLRRQELRLPFLRDMRPLTGTFTLAIEAARETLSQGAGRMAGDKGRAEALLDQVSEALAMLDELETSATLPREGRVGLAAARMGFVEASSLMEAGEYRAAEAKASTTLFRAKVVTGTLGEAFLRFADEERIRTWQRWISETVAWSRSQNAVAIVVIKERNLLEVYQGGRKTASYAADLGSNNLAQKYRQGDRATPEGRYKVRQIKGRGQSQYYRALLLDYPTPEDLRRIQAAKEAGIIPSGAAPGALIEIHGEGGRGEDWTNGCVAVTNEQMDELLRRVRVGTPVTIVGGDGSSGSFSSLAEKIGRGR